MNYLPHIEGLPNRTLCGKLRKGAGIVINPFHQPTMDRYANTLVCAECGRRWNYRLPGKHYEEER